MTGGLKPYPKYKQSSVSWLGQVPERWTVCRIKNVLRENDRRSPDGSGVLLSLTRVRGLIPHSDATDKLHSATTLVGYKTYRPGQIVMNRMQAWSGMFGATCIEGLVSPDYAVFDLLDNQRVDFALERLKAPDLVDQFALQSKGIGSGFNRLYTDRFGSIPLAVPPPDEQKAIVNFLNWSNLRIDRAIRAKRKIIALLNEQKQTIIQRAVTRGLDPKVRFKSSGIQGMNDIPEHWEVFRLRMVIRRIDQGVSPQAEALLAEDGAWGVLKSGCVNHGVFRDTEHKRLPDGFEIDSSLTVNIGDVLVSRACGSPALVGSVAKVKTLRYELLLSDKTFRLVFKDPALTDFLVAAMNTRYYRTQVEQAISGAEGLANNLPLSSLKDFKLVIPPKPEAKQIERYLAHELQRISSAIERTEREIGLLREYRTRLTADVVTGKLDVRGVELPEAEEIIEESITAEGEETDEAEGQGEALNEETYAND
ncbi:MAG: restriction endonuclease subunit S [Bryobacteraceae bacterium]|nr:restriction endonuclease subunit S [Bryobacteraceae bacterium]